MSPMPFAAIAMICLFHCEKPQASGTALENATGKDLRVEVSYRASDNRTVALVMAGSRIQLQTPADRIGTVRYAYEGHACVLTHDQVVAGAHTDKGKAVVRLEPCH